MKKVKEVGKIDIVKDVEKKNPTERYIIFTEIIRGRNLNYSESIGNFSILKKCNTLGKNFVFCSKNALGYNISEIMSDEFGFPIVVAKKNEKENSKAVAQFDKDCTIKDSFELDHRGYMKTEKGSNGTKRTSTIIVSDAIGILSYNGISSFCSNAGITNRTPGENPNIYNTEDFNDYMELTVIIDLLRAGVDENDNITLSANERIHRVNSFLDTMTILRRTVKKNTSNLAPWFVIGGNYKFGNPLFRDRVKIQSINNTGGCEDDYKFTIDSELVNFSLKNSPAKFSYKETTFVGSSPCSLGIENIDVPDSNKMDVWDFFTYMKTIVENYYTNI